MSDYEQTQESFEALDCFLRKYNPKAPVAPRNELDRLLRRLNLDTGPVTEKHPGWFEIAAPIGVAVMIALVVLVGKPQIPWKSSPGYRNLSPAAAEALYDAFFFDGDGSEEDAGI